MAVQILAIGLTTITTENIAVQTLVIVLTTITTENMAVQTLAIVLTNMTTENIAVQTLAIAVTETRELKKNPILAAATVTRYNVSMKIKNFSTSFWKPGTKSSRYLFLLFKFTNHCRCNSQSTPSATIYLGYILACRATSKNIPQVYSRRL